MHPFNAQKGCVGNEWVQIGLYTVSSVNHVLDNFEPVLILGIYKYTLFETLKALSRDGNDFRI